jgi:hypothetical protein
MKAIFPFGRTVTYEVEFIKGEHPKIQRHEKVTLVGSALAENPKIREEIRECNDDWKKGQPTNA